MITNATELAVNRRNTAAFIAADPETIALTPRARTKTGTGGYTWTDLPPREPQDFKVVERNSNAITRTRVAGGEQAEEEFTLVGNWDAVVAEHDVFTLRGQDWEVIQVDWFNGYEQRAQVRRYGTG